MKLRWFCLLLLAGCFKAPEPKTPTYSGLGKPRAPALEKRELSIENATLGIEILKRGDGPEVKEGNTVHVHYEGTFTDGTAFDGTGPGGSPFTFVLGQPGVIRGWQEGVLGMQLGEKRRLTIPPELGYGSRRTGLIPPNSTLIFEIELVGMD
ncbi:MAG: FKBP-type peptidyl-prolyl cis-trans isomerase [Planctomycetota bacterium]